eukprot:7383936-Prymnesium_polylepis.2
MRDSAAGERALLERLANMRAAHEVRVEQQRKADAEKLDQVRGTRTRTAAVARTAAQAQHAPQPARCSPACSPHMAAS